VASSTSSSSAHSYDSKRIRLVNSDELEEVGGLSGLSENEGLLEVYYDDSGAAGDATSGASDPRYHVGPGGTISRKLMLCFVAYVLMGSYKK
jgi:hypothetical protein